jgi:PAS domain S-box-containing protein
MKGLTVFTNENKQNTLPNPSLAMSFANLRPSPTDLEIPDIDNFASYEAASVAYLAISKDGKIIKINRAGVKLLGVEREQIIHQDFDRFVAEGYQDLWFHHCIDTVKHGYQNSRELMLLRADDTPVYALLSFIYQQAMAATPVFLVTISSIDRRKLPNNSLSNAAYPTELQTGIIVIDENKVIMSVNKAFSRITGYTAEEALNQNVALLCSGQHDENFHEFLWTSAKKNGRWEGEIWEKRKNGEVFPVWLALTAVYGTDGDIAHYVASFKDITVHKQPEKILLEARERLENQAITTTEELETVKKETEEINAALKILLQHRETDKIEAQLALSREVEETVLPFLEKLKKASTGRAHSTRLISALEANLGQLVKIYGRASDLPSAYQKLSPTEMQVASLVRQGLPSKVIAATLNISQGTVELHRKHIRKKLGLEDKASNLYNYLLSLSE